MISRDDVKTVIGLVDKHLPGFRIGGPPIDRAALVAQAEADALTDWEIRPTNKLTGLIPWLNGLGRPDVCVYHNAYHRAVVDALLAMGANEWTIDELRRWRSGDREGFVMREAGTGARWHADPVGSIPH